MHGGFPCPACSVAKQRVSVSRAINLASFINSKMKPNQKNRREWWWWVLFPFKICKRVCLALMKMSNPKQRELVHHLSKLQLGLAAQHDIITEQHGKKKKQTQNPSLKKCTAQHEKEKMKARLPYQRSLGIKLTHKSESKMHGKFAERAMLS